MIYIVYKTGSVVACPLDQEIELLAPFFIAGRDFDGVLKPIPSMTHQETLRALNPASIPFCAMQFRQPEVLIFDSAAPVEAPPEPVNKTVSFASQDLKRWTGFEVYEYYGTPFFDTATLTWKKDDVNGVLLELVNSVQALNGGTLNAQTPVDYNDPNRFSFTLVFFLDHSNFPSSISAGLGSTNHYLYDTPSAPNQLELYEAAPPK